MWWVKAIVNRILMELLLSNLIGKNNSIMVVIHISHVVMNFFDLATEFHSRSYIVIYTLVLPNSGNGCKSDPILSNFWGYASLTLKQKVDAEKG